MNCLKCGNPLTTEKQTKYCSERCCKLYLKSQYKKRNKEKLNEYARRHRMLGVTSCGKKLKLRYKHLQINKCSRCGLDSNLEVHHIIPRKCGGTNEPNNLILFCKKCHNEFERLTMGFWTNEKIEPWYEIILDKKNAIIRPEESLHVSTRRSTNKRFY